jgi:hypothetical protein
LTLTLLTFLLNATREDSVPLSPIIYTHDQLLRLPLEVKAWPDFTIHIDAVTGERRNLRAVLAQPDKRYHWQCYSGEKLGQVCVMAGR